MSRRLTLTIHHGVPVSLALAELAHWMELHENDPVKYPMTGIAVNRTKNIVLIKSDCAKFAFQACRDKVEGGS